MTAAARKTEPFIMLTRADIEGEIGQDAALLAVWIKLNNWAAWKPYTREFGGRSVALGLGQLVTTERAILGALRLGSRSVVRRCLATLTRLGRIAVEPRQEATLITVRPVAAGAARPNRPSNHHETAEELEPQGFPDEPEDGRTTSGTRYKTRAKDASKKLSPAPQVTRAYEPEPGRAGEEGVEWEELLEGPPPAATAGHHLSATTTAPSTGANPGQPPTALPPPAVAAPLSPDGDDFPWPGRSAAMAETLRYAQRRFARIFSSGEAEDFVAIWRESDWLTDDEVRSAIDWLATHPVARLETKSAKRVFYVAEAKRAYAPWDERVRAIIARDLATGRDLAEVAEELVFHNRKLDAGVLRSYVLRVGAELAADLRLREGRG